MPHRRDKRTGVEGRQLRARHMRPVVERRLVAKLLDRQIGLHLSPMLDDEAQGVRRLADDCEVEAPFAEDRFRPGFLRRIEHHEHALLAFRQHHFVGAHAGFATRDLVEIELDAEIALGAHLDRRRGEPGGAHVLNGDDAAAGHDLETGFEQQLFRKWIADLYGRALLVAPVVEFRRRHRRAVDAVAARLRAEINDRPADARGLGVENLVAARDAHRHGVDENIAVVAAVEIHRAADGRHAERIAVAADAGHHAFQQMARARMRRRAEAQQIEAGDRPRPHGEHVAQNSADTRGRTLIRLDERGMVVALHLEDAGLAVADVDDAGVFARPLNHPGSLRRQAAQMQPRGFIGTMLVPHGRENTQFGVGRRAPDQRGECAHIHRA